MAGTALAPATLNKSSKRKNHPSEIHTSLKTQLLFSLAASDEPGEQSGQARECRSHASESCGSKPYRRCVPRRRKVLLCLRRLGLGARHERLLLGWLHRGRGFLRVGLGLGLLERRDDRALGNSFVIGGVDYGIARADGLTCLVGDAAAVLFLVAIVNDLAACRRLDDGAFDLDSADRLAVRAYARAKIAAVSPSAVTLLRTIEMVAGVMPS